MKTKLDSQVSDETVDRFFFFFGRGGVILIYDIYEKMYQYLINNNSYFPHLSDFGLIFCPCVSIAQNNNPRHCNMVSRGWLPPL